MTSLIEDPGGETGNARDASNNYTSIALDATVLNRKPFMRYSSEYLDFDCHKHWAHPLPFLSSVF